MDNKKRRLYWGSKNFFKDLKFNVMEEVRSKILLPDDRWSEEILNDIIIENYIDLSFDIVDGGNSDFSIKLEEQLTVTQLAKLKNIYEDINSNKIKLATPYFENYINKTITEPEKCGDPYEIKIPFPVVLNNLLDNWRYSPYYLCDKGGISKKSLDINKKRLYSSSSNLVEKEIHNFIIERIYSIELLDSIVCFIDEYLAQNPKWWFKPYNSFIKIISELKNVTSIAVRNRCLKECITSFIKGETLDVYYELCRINEMEFIITQQLRESFQAIWNDKSENYSKRSKIKELSAEIKRTCEEKQTNNAIKILNKDIHIELHESTTLLFYNNAPFNIKREIDNQNYLLVMLTVETKMYAWINLNEFLSEQELWVVVDSLYKSKHSANAYLVEKVDVLCRFISNYIHNKGMHKKEISSDQIKGELLDKFEEKRFEFETQDIIDFIHMHADSDYTDEEWIDILRQFFAWYVDKEVNKTITSAFCEAYNQKRILSRVPIIITVEQLKACIKETVDVDIDIKTLEKHIIASEDNSFRSDLYRYVLYNYIQNLSLEIALSRDVGSL